MMNFDNAEMRDGFESAFGKPIAELTVEQVRWLCCMIKHCRGRCRSNAALNNYLNRNFTGHRFSEKKNEAGFDILQIEKKS